MTGNIGKPGTGANSITGQCNAMGSRIFSNTTGLLGGHDFPRAEHRDKIAGILGIPVEKIPAENSLAYDQIFEVDPRRPNSRAVADRDQFGALLDQPGRMRARS